MRISKAFTVGAFIFILLFIWIYVVIESRSFSTVDLMNYQSYVSFGIDKNYEYFTNFLVILLNIETAQKLVLAYSLLTLFTYFLVSQCFHNFFTSPTIICCSFFFSGTIFVAIRSSFSYSLSLLASIILLALFLAPSSDFFSRKLSKLVSYKILSCLLVFLIDFLAFFVHASSLIFVFIQLTAVILLNLNPPRIYKLLNRLSFTLILLLPLLSSFSIILFKSIGTYVVSLLPAYEPYIVSSSEFTSRFSGYVYLFYIAPLLFNIINLKYDHKYMIQIYYLSIFISLNCLFWRIGLANIPGGNRIAEPFLIYSFLLWSVTLSNLSPKNMKFSCSLSMSLSVILFCLMLYNSLSINAFSF